MTSILIQDLMLPSIHAAHVISQVHGMTEAYCAIHVISGTIFRANPWTLDSTMNLQMTAQLRGTVLCVDVQTIRHCYWLIFSTSNHYSVLSDTSLASPTPSNNIRPIHASTPDRKKNRRTKENAPLGIINVNFQSIKGKQGQVRNLIDSTNPDIIFGTETWIDSNIKDSQIFPSG